MATGEDLNEALMQIKMIARLAIGIDAETAQAVLNELGRMHALMPIADPTAYKGQMGRIDESDRLVRAFIAFRNEVEGVAEEERKRS